MFTWMSAKLSKSIMHRYFSHLHTEKVIRKKQIKEKYVTINNAQLFYIAKYAIIFLRCITPQICKYSFQLLFKTKPFSIKSFENNFIVRIGFLSLFQNALWVITMIMDSVCLVRAIVRTVHHATRQLGDVITDVLITGAGISVKVGQNHLSLLHRFFFLWIIFLIILNLFFCFLFFFLIFFFVGGQKY